MPNPKPILIVEDEPEIRTLLKLMLAERGYEVISAKDGTSALHELWKHRGNIALLVTDVDMGRMNGVELAESIRGEYPALPILFISGLPVERSELDRVAPGAGFVSKPFNAATLAEAVERLIPV